MRSGKLLLFLSSTVILGSESRWTHDHILLSHDSGSRGTFPPCPNQGRIPDYYSGGTEGTHENFCQLSWDWNQRADTAPTCSLSVRHITARLSCLCYLRTIFQEHLLLERRFEIKTVPLRAILFQFGHHYYIIYCDVSLERNPPHEMMFQLYGSWSW
jgi:hypothetical protein